jgi:hypothetical protein
MESLLGPDEPPAGPWRVESIGKVVDLLLDAAGHPAGRPCVVAVDGRGGGGKTTVSELLARSLPKTAVVHTDDVAWKHSFFGWTDLLAEGILRPLHRGESVSYRPPAWSQHGREGAIDVDSGRRTVLVEGVGAARRELMSLVDAVVWVQSDVTEAKRRCLIREGDDQAARDFWDEWMSEEIPFLSEQKPWERADVVVAGTPLLGYDVATQLVIASPPGPDPPRSPPVR